MKQKISILVGAIVVVILAVIMSVLVGSGSSSVPATVAFSTMEEIEAMADDIDFSAYDVFAVNPTDEQMGNLPEKVKGDAEKAGVVIYEFADYTCNHCATVNTELNRIYADYDGDIAIVFRNFLLGFKNSVTAASAANAADLQGYWDRYKNILFSEQASWKNLPQGSKLEEYFVSIFDEASDGAGDRDKFREDMSSTAVARRLSFDQAAANFLGLSSTPYLAINGKQVTAAELRSTIDSILNK